MTEFSAELGVPKSTLRAVMREGNTTLDTAMRLAKGLGVTLDELLCDEELPEKLTLAHSLLRELAWYAALPKERQAAVRFHLNGLLEAVDP